MKIFISHSSQNKNYGNSLVELLRSLGIKENEIIFTSNTAYGIPIGQNIFNWLKSQITEKPFVIYLLSEEYYESIACLNEMGAAWIVENEHAAIFTPNFNLSSKEFQSGALDPREIGFYINDEDRVLSLLQLLSSNFEITTNTILISQNVKRFIQEVNNLQSNQTVKQTPPKINIKKEEINNQKEFQQQEENTKPISNSNDDDLYSKFLKLILDKKLKEDELLLLHYILETGRFKLKTGWQEDNEISNIKEWEKINDINNLLSKNYSGVLKRFELRGFTEVSAFTGSNNPKEVKLKDEIATNILDLPNEVTLIIDDVVKRNFFEHIENLNDKTGWHF
ncbi:MAG: toll/interleukin-1 receptor domain-containing protein [Flavobacterium sp.]|uniref:toll/interleukin-1 receptor domain-containing protein n=1 Tax=Flavobacterium sp. TaxID=239 RepID=UPI0037BC6A9B